jgi:hypothetical protein
MQIAKGRLSKMIWWLSNRACPDAVRLADRHYNRQKVGARQFVPPGRCMVLYTDKAYWVTSWPFAEYVKHAWAGGWICSAFRNEGAGLSSELIRQAVAATQAFFGAPPDLGMVTFIDPNKVRDGKRSGRQLGRCYIKAGFKHVGETGKGLLAFQLTPADMPEPRAPLGYDLFA